MATLRVSVLAALQATVLAPAARAEELLQPLDAARIAHRNDLYAASRDPDNR